MIDVLVDDGIHADLPSDEEITHAVRLSCRATDQAMDLPQVCIRFASDDVVRKLNAQWRNKDKVTDVLSFPMQEGDTYSAEEPLGDIILAIPFVLQEAQRLQREPQAHILHLIIHAMLHLLGHDHVHDDEALVMQALESQIMQQMQLHQPYV